MGLGVTRDSESQKYLSGTGSTPLPANSPKKKQDEPRIFLDEYITIVNKAFGKNASPILDIMGWHFLRVTNDIVRFNKE